MVFGQWNPSNISRWCAWSASSPWLIQEVGQWRSTVALCFSRYKSFDLPHLVCNFRGFCPELLRYELCCYPTYPWRKYWWYLSLGRRERDQLDFECGIQSVGSFIKRNSNWWRCPRWVWIFTLSWKHQHLAFSDSGVQSLFRKDWWGGARVC